MWIDVEMGPKGIDPPVSSITLALRRVTLDKGEGGGAAQRQPP